MVADKQETILVVQADESVASLQRQRLERAGYRVATAGTAAEALRVLQQNSFDLILLDYYLPDAANGLDFYDRLKAAGHDLPLILVTAVSNEATVIAALRAGVRDFITQSAEYLDYLPEAIARVLNQVRTERLLAESEARLASIIASAKDAILVTEADQRIVLFNAAAEQMFRCPAAGALGQPLRRFIPPEFGAARSGQPESTHTLEESFTWQVRTGARGVRADGEEFPLEASLARAAVAGRKFYTIVVRDVTERKRSEAALHEAQELMKAVLDNIDAGIVACDAAGQLTLFNRAARMQHGLDEAPRLPEQWAGNCDFYLADGKTRMRTEDIPLYRALKEESVREVEMRLVPRQGRPRTFLATAHAMRDAAGRQLGAVMVLHDITERKQLEAQLHQAQRMEGIGLLAGGVAHDFNNLLTVITGFCELLLAQLPSGDAMRGPLGEIRKAGDRAAGLTRQLLAFSRKQLLAPQVLDLNALVVNLERMLRRIIGEDIALATVLDSATGPVKADPGQLEQVLMNLVVNARDAMPEGGRLTLETRNAVLDEGYARLHPEVRPGPYVLLAVSDTGIGMDEATQAQIFEPFFTTKGPGKGTGLGLATVYGVVKQSEGHIAVYSEPGKGATFKIYLPQAEEAASPGRSASIAVEIPQGKETILLAEDQDAVRGLVRLTLESCGYTVLEASNGEVALRLCEHFKGAIDLLVTDVVMPGLSGRRLASHLAVLHPNMRVLFMSGYADDAIVRHGVLEAGMPFLQKPFTPMMLARKVREVLDQAPASS
jgi:PAS domain S-box-containing protein